MNAVWVKQSDDGECHLDVNAVVARRVSNFNNKVTQGGIYPHIKFEINRLKHFSS